MMSSAVLRYLLRRSRLGGVPPLVDGHRVEATVSVGVAELDAGRSRARSRRLKAQSLSEVRLFPAP